MQTKLTLKLKDSLIVEAKQYAKSTGKSLSKVVADYFTTLDKRPKSSLALPPLTQTLQGVLKSSTVVNTQDYDHYREKKYL